MYHQPDPPFTKYGDIDDMVDSPEYDEDECEEDE